MKFDIIRQQVFTSLVTLFVMSIIALCMLCAGATGVNISIESGSIFGGYISDFQINNPSWSAIITSFLIFWSAVHLGRVISTQNLFGVTTSIHLPIIGAMLWGVTIGPAYLTTALVVSILSYALSELLLSFRLGNYLANLFNASMALSLLATIYTPAVILCMAIPITLLYIGVTFREWIVGIVGITLPAATVSYIYWLCGEDFLATATEICDMFMVHSTLFKLREIPILQTATLLLTLLLTLLSSSWITDMVFKSRQRLQVNMILLAVAAMTLAAPAASLLSFALLAPMLSVAVTFAMVNLRGSVANVLYIIILTISTLVMFLPLTLNLP